MVAQPSATLPTTRPKLEQALAALQAADTTRASDFWPNIKPGAYYANLRRNLLHPEGIYQGHSTNFCGYAAFTVLFCRDQPQRYVTMLKDLYEKGTARTGDETITPSPALREACGVLRGKGKLSVNPADQVWLMSLPDHFKGYMNIDRQFQVGDENKIWAACTFGKFNDMARKIGGFEVDAWGSDLIRPMGKKNHAAFIRKQLTQGQVVLYVNSKFLHPSKFRLFVLRAPTHFILVYDIEEAGNTVKLTYWDYGKKTFESMSRKRLKKMIFGISRLNTPSP